MFEMTSIIRSTTPAKVRLRCCECGSSLSLEMDKFELVNDGCVILKDGEQLSCPHCQNTQPDRYIPYQNARHIPECPVCHSVNVEKIGTLKKYTSFAAIGVFSSNMGKQFHCCSCGYKF